MRIIEHIYEFNLDSYDVDIRIWAKATTLLDRAERNRQRRTILEVTRIPLRKGGHKLDFIISIAEEIAKLDFCNAVEVRRGKSGVLIYPEWP